MAHRHPSQRQKIPVSLGEKEGRKKPMLRIYAWLKELFRREEGQDMVEYALITAIVGFTIIAVTFGLLSGAFNTWVTNLAQLITDNVT